MPYPMGRGLFIWDKPIWIASDSSDAILETKRRELEEALNRITSEADEAVSR